MNKNQTNNMELNLDKLADIVAKQVDSHANELIQGEQGIVASIGDGIVNATGLWNVMLNELVVFSGGERGLALNLEADKVGIVMLDDFNKISEGDPVYRTKSVLTIPVGEQFLGRVVNALGDPIDGKGPIVANEHLPIEKIAPGVMTRQSVDEPLETGILEVDSMFPIGKGQRELIIGDRQTGKTTVATDAIINQKGKNVKCVYVAIGQKNSTVANVVSTLAENGALDYTIVLSANAADLAAMQYIAPYSGITLAEYFLSKGEDCLIVFDDLSKHAVAYRTLSLLLRRPPGREAFPGDVFYLHSRLLERAVRLNKENGGGSITALPIIETQAGDISAYIPTNVISITDGQLFMQTSLFNAGQRPAIDAGLSVSRVGSAAQIKAIKQTAGSLKLILANYRELASFSQFGSDLDPQTKEILSNGEKINWMLRQAPTQPYSQIEEAILLFSIKENFLKYIPVDTVPAFKTAIINYFKNTNLFGALEDKKAFDDNLSNAFKYGFKELVKQFVGTLPDFNLSTADTQALTATDEEIKAYDSYR